ncbi:DUF4158 domain-containing protein [Nonomuraea fuscirosea]|uniref:DUF4158 domain-containing protein n=1 Tax=Nonomuraea fuscirosea TaxID=1291556 RepID=UPI0033D41759
MFTDEEIARLRSFPKISREELIRFFTLTAADVEFIDPGRGRGPADRLGLAVQLCVLPWLGFVPADVPSAPSAAVARLSERLRISVGELARYGGREQTRSSHLQQVARYLGWRTAGELERKELDEFLLARAMEHDSPSLLFRLACEHLVSSRVIRPGVVTLLERVAAARGPLAGRLTSVIAVRRGPRRVGRPAGGQCGASRRGRAATDRPVALASRRGKPPPVWRTGQSGRRRWTRRGRPTAEDRCVTNDLNTFLTALYAAAEKRIRRSGGPRPGGRPRWRRPRRLGGRGGT